MRRLIDPSCFDGFCIPDYFDDDTHKKRVPRPSKENVVQSTTAAGVRALSVQMIAFYFRAPVKAFFKQRFDYMVGFVVGVFGTPC